MNISIIVSDYVVLNSNWLWSIIFLHVLHIFNYSNIYLFIEKLRI